MSWFVGVISACENSPRESARAGEHNTQLNKVSTCVLHNFTVKYGGGRYSAHVADETHNTPPVESEISLSFKELELITKTRASQGF